MKWPFVSRARYEQAAGIAEYAIEQLIDTQIVNDCLTQGLEKAAAQGALSTEAATQIIAAYTAERHRADRLQQRLDNAVGLNTSQVDDGRFWQHNRHDKKKGFEL